MTTWHFSRSLLLALGLLAAAHLSAPQSAPPREEPAAIDAQFLKLEQDWMDALAAKDREKLEATLADDFTIIGAGSTLADATAERGAWLEVAMQRPFPRHEVRILKVTQLADAAVVHCVLKGEYPPMPWIPEGGTLEFLITDTWIHRDGRWQVIARHSSLPAKPPEAGE